ncbi:MAG: anti-sigma factor antagonist [Bacteroidaceae bacterium]|nr:anti-sigma factor antagonist [Bacteroidaceae bacterium]
MEISVNNINGLATLKIIGRLDTYAASKIAGQITQELEECGEIRQLVCDLEELDYISSSGLRIMLGLAKKYKNNFSIIEANPTVYQVFETTGFVKLMKIEKALRRLSVEECQEIGKGGVGVVYRLDDDTIIKVFREGTTMQELKNEINMAKEAFVMGMPTAISFDIVRVGNQYGLVYELLNAETLSACLKRNPERLEELAKLYAGLFRQLHSIEVPQGSSIPSALENEIKAINHIGRYFDQESLDILMEIVKSIPKGNRLLHCDLQSKNAMLQGDELMLIDMGEVGYGHPLTDLGHSYSAMVTLLGDYASIIGLPQELAVKLWHRMIHHYFEGASEEEITHRIHQIEVVSCVRAFSWLSLSDSFPEEVIRMCQDAFKERVADRKDYIKQICSTFGDWEM